MAERLGFDQKEALSLGKAVAGLMAQSKGRRLGIFTPSPATVRKVREQKRATELLVEILGRHVPAISTPEGIRAVNKAKPVDPAVVERYLKGKFGEALPAVQPAMAALAKAFKPEQLAREAFRVAAHENEPACAHEKEPTPLKGGWISFPRRKGFVPRREIPSRRDGPEREGKDQRPC